VSVEASGWAFRQAIPAKAKMALMALADQADERSGAVCYGSTDMPYIARKASLSLRSLYRYVAALELNGYLRRETGRGRGHVNAFWLCLDRPSGGEWLWTSPPSVKCANLAYMPTGGTPNMPTGGTPNVPYLADIIPKNIKEHRKAGLDNCGDKAGQPGTDARAKPPHGSKGRGMVWLDHGTDEWQSYADDYFEQRGVKKNPEQRIGGSGNWFVLMGEPENGNHRIQNQTPRARP
jgi:hypothetical protein